MLLRCCLVPISYGYMSFSEVLRIGLRVGIGHTQFLTTVYSLLLVFYGVSWYCSLESIPPRYTNGNCTMVQSKSSDITIKLEREKSKLARYEQHESFLLRYKDLDLVPTGLKLDKSLQMGHPDTDQQNEWDMTLHIASCELRDIVIKVIRRNKTLIISNIDKLKSDLWNCVEDPSEYHSTLNRLNYRITKEVTNLQRIKNNKLSNDLSSRSYSKQKKRGNNLLGTSHTQSTPNVSNSCDTSSTQKVVGCVDQSVNSKQVKSVLHPHDSSFPLIQDLCTDRVNDTKHYGNNINVQSSSSDLNETLYTNIQSGS